MHIWNSRIANNSQNGVRIVNLRSLVEINQTVISHNRRHGLDIDSGAGLFTLNLTLKFAFFSVLHFQVHFGHIIQYLIPMVKMAFIYSTMVENVEYSIRIFPSIINMVYPYDWILVRQDFVSHY